MPSPSLMLSKASKSGSSDLSPSSASSSCHDAFQQLIRWECNKWCLASKRNQFPLLAFRVVNAVPPQWPSRRYHAFKSCCANICNLFNAATTLTCSFNHTCSFSLIWFDVYSDDVVITGIVLASFEIQSTFYGWEQSRDPGLAFVVDHILIDGRLVLSKDKDVLVGVGIILVNPTEALSKICPRCPSFV